MNIDNMDVSFVESATASLVREYLSRKGLKKTLQMMDEELPRDNSSISNRMHLRQVLHMDRLMNKNKESECPMSAMLEVMCKSFIDKAERAVGAPPPRPGTARSLYPETASDRSHCLQNDEPPSARDADCSGAPLAAELGSSNGRARRGNRAIKESDSDLVIDDDVEGETLLGAGRGGLLRQRSSEERVGRPGPERSSRTRGMSGLVSATKEDRRSARRSRHDSSAKKQLDVDMTYTDPLGPLERRVPSVSDVQETAGRPSRHNKIFEAEVDLDLSNGRPGTALSMVSGRRPTSSAQRPRMSASKEGDLEDDSSASSDSATGDLGNRVGEEAPGDNRVARSGTGSGVARSAQWRQRDDTLAQYGVSKSCVVSELTAKKPANFLDTVNNTRPAAKMTRYGDVELGDCDDLDLEVAKLDLRPRKPLLNSTCITNSRPIDVKTASELKKLCLGSPSLNFNDEWLEQAFTFNPDPKLSFGIVQKRGGPCGLLAAVQACMLQQLLFCIKREKNEDIEITSFEVAPQLRTEALALGLADMFWRAGDEKQAVVTIKSTSSILAGSGRYRADGLTEKLVLYHFKSKDDLIGFLKDHITLFEEEGQPGVVLTLYSTILSCGINKVWSDMDEPEGMLLGQHGYCTQELVNLLLTGQASSNTFNDMLMVDGMKLRGVVKRSSIGFMSLFEHYKSCEVGTYYKTPKYPIWVVCSESHFTVLFCLRKELMSDWRVERRFNLYYYDGLAHQDEQIKLTVVTSNHHYRPPADDNLTSPLELCIRTKWGEAEIDWNGTEPLL